MSYDPRLKLTAIRLFETDLKRDISDVYNILVNDYNFTGTKAIVKLWINDKTSLLERYSDLDPLPDKHENMKGDKDYVQEQEDSEEEEITSIFSPDEELDDQFENGNITIDQYHKLRRSRQNLMDQNRILRKMFREKDRVVVATRQLLEEIKSSIPGRTPVKLSDDLLVGCDNHGNRVAIVQLSDWHIIEEVQLHDTKGKNEYNFVIAGRRLHKYAVRVRELLKAYGIENVVIAITGDMFNSSRRKDEILRNLKAMSEGFLIGADLVASFIQDLARYFNITVVSVFGNESRLDEEIQSIDFHNNFDFLLHHFLSVILRDQSNVHFAEVTTDHELLINVNTANILLWHGHNRSSLERLVLKYAKMDKIVHYVITGHKHHLKLEEMMGMSGSGVGDNAYNFSRLSVVSRVSQNTYIIERNENGRPDILPHPIDLQDTTSYEGYPVHSASNVTGLRTAHLMGEGETILRIVI